MMAVLEPLAKMADLGLLASLVHKGFGVTQVKMESKVSREQLAPRVSLDLQAPLGPLGRMAWMVNMVWQDCQA